MAIKILPEEFSRDADHVSRFQREAEVLASLNRSHLRYRRSRQHTIEGIVYNGPRAYDITPDRKAFVVMLPAGQDDTGKAAPQPINVVLTWFE